MNYKNTWRLKIACCLLILFQLLTATGCSQNESGSQSISSNSRSSSEKSAALENSVVSDSLDEDGMFTQRDKEIEYDESQCTKIQLSDTEGSVTISEEGTYLVTGSLTNGQLVVDTDKTEKVRLILDGVDIHCDTSAALYIKQADKVFITLAPDSINTLSNSSDFIAIDDNHIDAVLFSKEDVTLNGLGSLNIEAVYGHGIVSKDDLVITSGTYCIQAASHGMVGKDCVKIADGTFAIESGKDGIHSENADDSNLGYLYIADGDFTIQSQLDGLDSKCTLEIAGGAFQLTTGGGSQNASTKADGQFNSDWGNWGGTSQTEEETDNAKGIKSTSDLIIRQGTFTIDSSDDSLHSNANLTIQGGSFQISSGDDGVHADQQTVIEGGTLNITKSYEGIEGQSISISGGELFLVASDDGLNAAGGNDQSALGGRPGMNAFEADADCFIEISGGKLVINSSGDGIDSNGSLTVTGGETYVNGPTNSGNGALDYAGEAQITGGIFLAVGASGMAQNFGDSSTQASIMANVQNGQQGGTIVLSDSNGNSLFTYIPEKQFQSVVISIPQLEIGQTYTLTVGSESQSIQLSSVIYGSSGGMMMPGGGMRGEPKGQEMPSPPEGEQPPNW